jgi:hypothetical protein
MVVLTAVAINSAYRQRMRRPRPPHVVALAWIVTGPVGHLYAGVLDWAQVLAQLAWARARGERL